MPIIISHKHTKEEPPQEMRRFFLPTGNARVHDTATCPSLRHAIAKGQIKTRADSQIPVAFSLRL
ncbi:MAG: hypothetical protein ACLVH7_16855 [Flavonifractor plautii]